MAVEHDSPPAEISCAHCGDRSPAPGPFCGRCGAPRTEPSPPLPAPTARLRCPHCGVLRTSTGQLCGSCGADTETDSVPPSAASATPALATHPRRSTDICPNCGAPRPATGRFCDSCEYVPAAVRRSGASARTTDIASSPGLVPTVTITGPQGVRRVVHARVPTVSSQPEKKNVTKSRPLSQRRYCADCDALRTSSARLCESCGVYAETVTAPPGAPHLQQRPNVPLHSLPAQTQPPPPSRSTVAPTDLSVTVHRAWKVAVGGLVLGIALGVGATLLISSSGGSGGSDPAQAASCARAAQLQKQADAGPPPVQGTGQFADPARSTSLYNATLSQLASQTALCHGH